MQSQFPGLFLIQFNKIIVLRDFMKAGTKERQSHTDVKAGISKTTLFLCLYPTNLLHIPIQFACLSQMQLAK